MNIIEMDYGDYNKYIRDQKFLETQLRRYSEWLLKYRDDGDVALFNFVLVSHDLPRMALCANKTPEDGTYNIMAYVPMKIGDSKTTLYPLVIACSLIPEGGILDIYCDIPKEDEQWRKVGIHDFSDLDYRAQADIVKFAIPILCLFAKVQTDSFKSRKKIIRMVEEEESKPKQKAAATDNAPIKRKPILLSPGIRYTYQTVRGLPRSFVRHCEAWTVRGHYRHYKSGRVSYIKPHIRGAGRIKDTTYSVKED